MMIEKKNIKRHILIYKYFKKHGLVAVLVRIYRHVFFYLFNNLVRKMVFFLVLLLRPIFLYPLDFFQSLLKKSDIDNIYKDSILDKVTIVFQLESFDRGGLEEVVYLLSSKFGNLKKFNVVVFVNSNKLGYFGEKAKQHGIKIVLLHKNKFILRYAIKKLGIKLVNLHYSVFGIEQYAKYGVKVLYTVHNNYIWADNKFIKERCACYDKVDKFIAVSTQVKEYFSRKFAIANNNVVVVHNGIDESILNSASIEKREVYGVADGDFVFINVASFTLNKFHPLMVAAIAKLSKKYLNMKLLFVGNILDKKYYQNVLSLIGKHGLNDNIKIIDYVPKQKVLGLMNMSDCFLFPSLTEGWGIATTEAMLCGLPLILSEVGGAIDFIDNNDIGIIIKNPYGNIQDLNNEMLIQKYFSDEHLNNLDDLYDAMENMYLNKRKWKSNAIIGKDKIVERFNEEKMINGYNEEFCKILNK
jgi:glycosyltransferase involved in cell wall biosynthesis